METYRDITDLFEKSWDDLSRPSAISDQQSAINGSVLTHPSSRHGESPRATFRPHPSPPTPRSIAAPNEPNVKMESPPHPASLSPSAICNLQSAIPPVSASPRPRVSASSSSPVPNNEADTGDLASIVAGWPEEMSEGCVRLDPAAVLRANSRSFALRVRGQSMVNAGIYDGDIVVGEITPVARDGAIVVALIDGESTLKRLVVERGRPYLISENPSCPAFTPLGELVIQGVVHTVVRRIYS